jgi:DEAD/DEAH box helicase domain-containing protein
MEDQEMTYTGVINYETGEEIDVWENEYDKIKKILFETDLIIGYNSISFDVPVLAKHIGQEANDLPMLDLMVAAFKTIGFRPKLNNLANATLGRGKLGTGSDAGIYYAEGRLDDLKKYCMEDVRLTRDLYDYGLKNGKIKYFDRNGFLRETSIDWSLGYKNYAGTMSSSKKEEKEPETLSLF